MEPDLLQRIASAVIEGGGGVRDTGDMEGATSFFRERQVALNRAYRIFPDKQRKNLINFRRFRTVICCQKHFSPFQRTIVFG